MEGAIITLGTIECMVVGDILLGSDGRLSSGVAHAYEIMLCIELHPIGECEEAPTP